jgi:DNA-binding transcriptional LysR family regulator
MFLKDLQEFSLQGLRVFCYVASMGSVVEAADALGLTQPAVSLQIHNLEKQLGFHLFERQGRKNVLTTQGLHFFRKLLPHLERLEDLLLEIKVEDSGRSELSLGSIEGIGEYWIWKRFKEFSKKHDGLRIFLEIQDSKQLEDYLVTGRLSIIITARKVEHPQVVSQVLMDEKLLPIGTAEQIENLRKEFTKKLDTPDSVHRPWEFVRWIGRGDTTSRDPWALRWLEKIGLIVDRRFKYFHQANSYAVVRHLLLEGEGVCVAPEHSFETELREQKLVKFENAEFPALTNRLYISHRESALSRIHNEFQEWVISTASTTPSNSF